jgi:hypothetical protein
MKTMTHRLIHFTAAACAALTLVSTAHAVDLRSWDQKLAASKRFVVLASFNNEAVLDKETQLVWERAPATTTQTWTSGLHACLQSTKGGRKGWRLPSVTELASLIDPSVASPGPTLPAGHPFTANAPSGAIYWSATSNAATPTLAWLVSFGSGNVFTLNKVDTDRVWCVRGGMNADQY